MATSKDRLSSNCDSASAVASDNSQFNAIENALPVSIQRIPKGTMHTSGSVTAAPNKQVRTRPWLLGGLATGAAWILREMGHELGANA
jgi:hypothetical protein